MNASQIAQIAQLPSVGAPAIPMGGGMFNPIPQPFGVNPSSIPNPDTQDEEDDSGFSLGSLREAINLDTAELDKLTTEQRLSLILLHCIKNNELLRKQNALLATMNGAITGANIQAAKTMAGAPPNTILKTPRSNGLSGKKLLASLAKDPEFRLEFSKTFYQGVQNPIESQYTVVKQGNPSMADSEVWEKAADEVYEQVFKGKSHTRALTKLCKEQQVRLEGRGVGPNTIAAPNETMIPQPQIRPLNTSAFAQQYMLQPAYTPVMPPMVNMVAPITPPQSIQFN
jgi:hypothetical protein